MVVEGSSWMEMEGRSRGFVDGVFCSLERGLSFFLSLSVSFSAVCVWSPPEKISADSGDNGFEAA